MSATSIEGLVAELVAQVRDELLADVRAELHALNQKLDALVATNGHEVGWYDLERGAHYLSLTKGALDRAVRRGAVECERTANGRIRFSREQLDSYATGNGAKS